MNEFDINLLQNELYYLIQFSVGVTLAPDWNSGVKIDSPKFVITIRKVRRHYGISSFHKLVRKGQ